MSLSRSAVRQRIAAKLAELADWSESGEPYGRLDKAAEGDFHQRFAVRVGAGSPMDERLKQRANTGVAVESMVRIQFGYDLRSPPDTVVDEDAASDAGHALLKKVFEIARSTDLSIRWASFDEPQVSADGRSYIGGITLRAHHRLDLE